MVPLPFSPMCEQINVCCLSCTSWYSWDYFHYYCSRHLWCWWSLFSEYCTRSWIIFTKSARSTTRPLYFWNCGSNSKFSRWQRSINDASWTFLPSFLASAITSFLISDFRQLPCRYLLKFFPFFIHCCLCIWYFHCLRHGSKFVHKTAVTQWTCASS